MGPECGVGLGIVRADGPRAPTLNGALSVQTRARAGHDLCAETLCPGESVYP